jgi:hypothetical protein
LVRERTAQGKATLELRKGVDEEMKNRIEMVKSDNEGRRTGVERRLFSYATHIPEKRVLKDRRVVKDRRTGRAGKGRPR